MIIEDALSGENRFDETPISTKLYIDEVVVDVTEDALVATLSGSLNGEQDQDRVFHGDKINFTSREDDVSRRRPRRIPTAGNSKPGGERRPLHVL